ncbi:MAG: hypothetical protein JJU03_08275 [Idiomarina sp.]|nr:hypothetical protein [Idiomarina sp.]
MTAKHLQTALFGSLGIAMGLAGISQQAQATQGELAGQANAQGSAQHAQLATDTPTDLVQAFLNTMDYQYLSDEDKAVWDEQTWNQIQGRSAHANQTRLSQDHEFYQLESFVRGLVKIEAIAYERADDGSVRVTAQTHYPNLLILVDDYAETRSSSAYEQLADYQVQFESGELNAESISVYTSEMPWRVNDSGVYVNAAQMQENMETEQAQGGW